jgi:CDP-paratose 2-epimerase
MRILITGICGFVGTTIATGLREHRASAEIAGVDSFVRPGSETNRLALKRAGAVVVHGDVRQASDVDALPPADWVIDAAANPSVLAGVDGHASSRQVVEHNLGGTINVLEYCRRHRAGLILLSTSRVYSIAAQLALPLRKGTRAFALDASAALPPGVSAAGIAEPFSTEPPLSLYGATKRASEQLALEYASAFGFPVWIDRCGVLAGAGQFARPDQGIFSYWIHSWAARRPLKYIGYGGLQVRDCLHPRDLVPLLLKQIADPAFDLPPEGGSYGSSYDLPPEGGSYGSSYDLPPEGGSYGTASGASSVASGFSRKASRIFNVSGGSASATSLRECSDWCAARFGAHTVTESGETRPFDLPWTVLDSAACNERWGWTPTMPRDAIFEEIAAHAGRHPEWLELSST